MQITFLGLGTMGMPMATHILHAGHNITVNNRSGQKIATFAKNNPNYNKPTNLTLQQSVVNADIFITCIGGDNDLREVAGLSNKNTITNNGVLNSLKPGCLWIDHSTVSAKVTLEIGAAAKKKDIHLLDAPISGGQAGAENATLAIMVGGEKENFNKALPLLKIYGKNIVHIGELGSGQKTKMANQLCIAGILAGLSDALAFVKKSGLDGEKVLSAISKGAAGSWQMENRGLTMLQDEFDFGFAINWMAKDLSIVLEAASELGTPTHLLREVLSKYHKLQKDGFGQLDSSALMKISMQNKNENEKK